jgi:ABC-type transport system involved in cytochrome c biogenesis permease component
LTAVTRPSSSPASRPRVVAIAAFLRRDFGITRSYRFPFVLDAISGLFQLGAYFFLSRTFGDVGPEQLNGAPTYFGFAAVGVVISMVINATVQGMAQRVREEQLCGSLEALMAQPLNALQTCVGLTAFPFAFALTRATFYLILASFWMELDLAKVSFIGVAVIFVLSATALACVGVLAAAVVLVLKRGEVLTSILVFGMTLISGSIFPVSALPNWLASVGSVLPFRFAFDGARDALFLGSGWGSDALALAAFTVVGFPLAVWLFATALHSIRRTGSLGQY